MLGPCGEPCRFLRCCEGRSSDHTDDSFDDRSSDLLRSRTLASRRTIDARRKAAVNDAATASWSIRKRRSTTRPSPPRTPGEPRVDGAIAEGRIRSSADDSPRSKRSGLLVSRPLGEEDASRCRLTPNAAPQLARFSNYLFVATRV